MNGDTRQQERSGGEDELGSPDHGAPQLAVGQWLDQVLRDSRAAAVAPASVSVEDSLDIRVVVDLRAQLLDALEKAETVIVDLSRVSSADAAGLQLLLGAQRHASACGRRLELAGATPALRSAASAAGLQDVLGLS
ncbi:MAG: STAS domain-containing protein [Gammaproteobacteria bacterium]